LVDGWERLLPLVHVHALVRELIVHTRIQAKVIGRELREHLLLWNQSRRDVWTVAWADVRIAVVEIELTKRHDIGKKGGVLLSIE
jgi:hypothetical protein